MSKGKTIVISEELLNLLIEGKLKIAKGKKLKYGRYKIIRHKNGS